MLVYHDQLYRKFLQLFGLFLIGISVIVGRLIYLQIVRAHNLFQRSEKNFLRVEKVAPPRGNILDTHGRLMATNRPLYNLVWTGTGKHRLSAAQEEALAQVERILEISCDHLMTGLRRAERTHQQVILARDISLTQLSRITEQFPAHPNITISTEFKRFYPCQAVASHIVGYLGQLEHERQAKGGLMGLEKIFEQQLQGHEGTILKTINSVGRNLKTQQMTQTTAGNDLVTTIDLDLQQIAERVFDRKYAGVFIIMDPLTGALRTLVSRPDFDPNIFLNPIAPDVWQEIVTQKPFLNRAFSACYPPGSIFKLITVSAALETGIIEEDSIFTCRGYTTFGQRKYLCSNHSGHGPLTTKQALAMSCNILFFEIGKHMSIDLLADYAYRFGLGKKTTVPFPEKLGIVPSTTWKRTALGERWWQGETLSATIGQSFLLVTPMQIARMIASIGQGYLVKPRILESEPIEQEPLDLKEETLQFLKDSMEKVVQQGTGRRLSTMKDIEIYAKTSTAQTTALSKRKLGKEYLEHGWFVANVRYQDNPPLTIVVLVEHAGNAQVPALIAKSFLMAYIKMMNKLKNQGP